MNKINVTDTPQRRIDPHELGKAMGAELADLAQCQQRIRELEAERDAALRNDAESTKLYRAEVEKLVKERDAAVARIQSAEHRRLDAEQAAVEHANRMNAAIAERDKLKDTLERSDNYASFLKLEAERDAARSNYTAVEKAYQAAVKLAEALAKERDDWEQQTDENIIRADIAESVLRDSQAQAAAMRAAAEAPIKEIDEMIAGLSGPETDLRRGWEACIAPLKAALASDAGKGWRSPEEAAKQDAACAATWAAFNELLTVAREVQQIGGHSMDLNTRLLLAIVHAEATLASNGAITAWQAAKTA